MHFKKREPQGKKAKSPKGTVNARKPWECRSSFRSLPSLKTRTHRRETKSRIHAGDRQYWCYLHTYLGYSCAGTSFRIRCIELFLQEGDQAFKATVSVGSRLALFPAANAGLFQFASSALSTLSNVGLRFRGAAGYCFLNRIHWCPARGRRTAWLTTSSSLATTVSTTC